MTNQLAPTGKGRYAFLLYDATFKVVVCTPENEQLLIEIIELLIPGKRISHIIFINREQHGLVVEEKNVTFDLLCEDADTHEQFLVEVQNREMDTFLDRMLSYSTYPIREQMAVKLQRRRSGEKVDPMDYSLTPVYVICMANFALEHDSDDALEQGYISRYEIRNGRNGELFTHSLNFVFLEMGRQTLQPGEEGKCRNVLEKFIFSMKNMHLLSERPASFDEPILLHLYQAAELASMTVTQRQNYDKVMTNEIDKMCEISFARRKGREEGAEQQALETARRMREMGLGEEIILQATGLTEEQVRAL